VCENGYGKRTPFGANTVGAEPAEVEETVEEPPAESAGEEDGASERSAMHYRKQRRGGKGVRDIRTSERNGHVVGVVSVRDADDIMLITTGGMVNRTHVREIRVVGRNTQGVRIMNLNEGDKIASIAQVAREEPEERAQPVEPPPDTPSNESEPLP
jgi:DNA gyrase subunit A